jgi:hypothetical protein
MASDTSIVGSQVFFTAQATTTAWRGHHAWLRRAHFLVSIVGTFIGVRLRFRDCQKNGVIGPDTPSLLGGKDQS